MRQEESDQSKWGCMWTHMVATTEGLQDLLRSLRKVVKHQLGDKGEGAFLGPSVPSGQYWLGSGRGDSPACSRPGTVRAVGFQDCVDLILLAAVRTGHTQGLNQVTKGNPGLFAFRTCTFSNISHDLLKLTERKPEQVCCGMVQLLRSSKAALIATP